MSFIPSALNLDPYLAWPVDNGGKIQLPFEVGGYFEPPFTAFEFAYHQEPNIFQYEFGAPSLVDGQIEPMNDPGTELNAIGAGVAPLLITEPGDNHYPGNRDTLQGEHLTGGSKPGNRKTKVDRLKQCPYCHKMFDSKPSNWNRHIDVHRGYKHYKCAVCDKELITKEQVVVHCIRQHMGVELTRGPTPAQRTKAMQYVVTL